MDKSWRQGEVTEVRVSLETEQTCRISSALFRLQVKAWSSFLHPAACYAVLTSGQDCSYSLYRRYKDLAAVDKQLRWLYPDLPPFPPKKWLVVKAETFLQKRAEQLNDYFEQSLVLGEVRRSQVLMEALHPSVVLVMRVLGCPASGKSAFVRRFLHYTPTIPQATLRCSVALQPSRENGQSEYTLPVDLIVDGQMLRLAAIDLIDLSDDDGGDWLLHSVKSTGLVLVVKAANSVEGAVFAERRWQPSDKSVDTDQEGRQAYDTVCQLIRDYLKLIAASKVSV